jgi:hypothetical protein
VTQSRPSGKTDLDGVFVDEFSVAVDVFHFLVAKLHPVAPVERCDVVLHNTRNTLN